MTPIDVIRGRQGLTAVLDGDPARRREYPRRLADCCATEGVQVVLIEEHHFRSSLHLLQQLASALGLAVKRQYFRQRAVLDAVLEKRINPDPNIALIINDAHTLTDDLGDEIHGLWNSFATSPYRGLYHPIQTILLGDDRLKELLLMKRGPWPALKSHCYSWFQIPPDSSGRTPTAER
jgi:hypothetical protein